MGWFTKKAPTRNAYCSFCRKNYRVVGPLVEGPGDIYICGDCVALCESIIAQHRMSQQGRGKEFLAIGSTYRFSADQATWTAVVVKRPHDHWVQVELWESYLEVA